MSSPLQKALIEATILFQIFVAGLHTARGLATFASFTYLHYETPYLFIAFTLIPILWIIVLLTALTQIRLKNSATARQTLYIEVLKSGTVTILWVWFVVQYAVNFSHFHHGPPGQGISVFHLVFVTVVYVLFNSFVFYPTLWIGWKAAREGGISLGERIEPLLPQ